MEGPVLGQVLEQPPGQPRVRSQRVLVVLEPRALVPALALGVAQRALHRWQRLEEPQQVALLEQVGHYLR